MDEHVSQQSVERHLEEVLASEVFARAALQSRALRILARAAMNGSRLRGIELASQVYGRSGPSYIKAAQQLVREIRLKLPLYYAGAPGAEFLFEIAADRHELVVRSADNGRGPDDGLPKIHI